MARPTQAVDPLTSAAQRYRQLQRWHDPSHPKVLEAGQELRALRLEKLREAVKRECAEQGIPFHVADETTLGKLAELFRGEPAPA